MSLPRPLLALPFLTILAVAQTNPPRLNLPYGPTKRLIAPNRAHILYGVVSQTGPQLWIENTRTHQRKMLLIIGGTLSAAWFPDSTAFYVEDRRASDSTLTYIYQPDTLQRLDIPALIQAAFPLTRRFAEGHAYFTVDRFDGPQHLLIQLRGHTDQPPPVECFQLRFRVDRAGAVQKLSERISPVTSQGCQE